MHANRFKFRAWDIQEKKMIDCGISANGAGFVRVANLVNVVFEPIVNGLNAVIMQCTGLVDCNGKPIFEGDVVIVHEHREHDDDFDRKYCVGPVVYGDGAWRVHPFRMKEPAHFVYAWLHVIEVLGNIYENPELAEKCKE